MVRVLLLMGSLILGSGTLSAASCWQRIVKYKYAIKRFPSIFEPSLKYLLKKVWPDIHPREG
jgi:hypothetical protein